MKNEPLVNACIKTWVAPTLLCILCDNSIVEGEIYLSCHNRDEGVVREIAMCVGCIVKAKKDFYWISGSNENTTDAPD